MKLIKAYKEATEIKKIIRGKKGEERQVDNIFDVLLVDCMQIVY